MVQFLLGRPIPDSVRLMSERLSHGGSCISSQGVAAGLGEDQSSQS